jgi:tRNA(Ile2) C34 agmatinyltransferase TiaS
MNDKIQAIKAALEGRDDDLLLEWVTKAVEDGCNTDSAHAVLADEDAHIERLKARDGSLFAIAEVSDRSGDPDADDFVWKNIRICRGMDGDFSATLRSIAEALIKNYK